MFSFCIADGGGVGLGRWRPFRGTGPSRGGSGGVKAVRSVASPRSTQAVCSEGRKRVSRDENLLRLQTRLARDPAHLRCECLTGSESGSRRARWEEVRPAVLPSCLRLVPASAAPRRLARQLVPLGDEGPAVVLLGAPGVVCFRGVGRASLPGRFAVEERWTVDSKIGPKVDVFPAFLAMSPKPGA